MSMTFSRQHKKLFKLDYIIFLIFLRFCMFLPIRKLFCLMVNHDAGDIRVWPFLDNIKMLSKLEYIIFLIFLRFCMFYPSGNFLSYESQFQFTPFRSRHLLFFSHDTFIPSVKEHSSTPWNKFIPLESHHVCIP